MDTLSDSSAYTSGQRRKKPVTYGRAARNKAFTPQSVGNFFDNRNHNDHDRPNRLKTPSKSKTLLKRTPIREPAIYDEFDVPPSDDDTATTTQRPQRDEYDVPLSDSEATVSKQRPPRDEFDVPISDDEPAKPSTKTTLPRNKSTPVIKTRKSSTIHSTAKSQNDYKRSGPGDIPAAKRTRTSSPASPPVVNTSNAAGTKRVPAMSWPKHISHNTTDTPRKSLSRSASSAKANARRSGRTPVQNTLIQSGISAPARLTDMLSEPSLHEVSFEDSELPGTPPPRPALRRAASTTTPKQSSLWSQLLSSDPVDLSLEASADQSKIRPGSTNTRRNFHSVVRPTPSVSHNGMIPHSNRLVDRLKQNLSSGSDDDMASSADDSDQDGELTLTELNTDGSGQKSKTPPKDSQLQHSQNASGSQMTYAQQRSYLQEETTEDNLLALLSVPTPTFTRPPANAHRSGPLAKGKSASTFDMDSDSDDAAATGIRSIHELRAAGSKKRFLDDNAALFDDIKDHEPTSRSRRRSALLELASKLFDKAFLHRFIEHGFDGQLVEEFAIPYSDPIADAILCGLLAKLAESDMAETAVVKMYKAGALDVAARCLDEDRTMAQAAKDRRNNMSRVAQSSLSEFSDTFRKAKLWGENQPTELTIILLGLKCMELIVLRLRRQGNRGSILALSTVSKLVGLATDVEASGSVHVCAQETALSVLELASTSNALVNTWPADLWRQIVCALPAMLQCQDQTQAQVLKICINLTNDNPRNCEMCSNEEVIKAIASQIVEGFRHLHDDTEDEKYLSRRDSLVLTTGLMTNLAEFSDEACEQVVVLRENGLASMVGVFLKGQEKVEEAQSEEETQSNVAYGFLAVLLGNLCQNSTARDELRASLPGKKLQPLVNAIDEFAQYNHKVDSQAFENEDGKEVWQKFTGKLMAVAARVQQYEI